MNVYNKLQTARVQLQNKNLKKTGLNKYSGFKYFELSDFLPEINILCKELQLFTQFNFTTEEATLTIVNIDKPDEKIIFNSPMAEATLKGCHAIQNIGAVQTYQRRYLLMVAFEIVEFDILDSTVKIESKKELSQLQIKRLYTIAGSKGYDSNSVKRQILKNYNKSSTSDLTYEEYNELIAKYESLQGVTK
ncbi:hypothetical protein AN644_00165 [Candidatus Epulonipiscium fishelsonii]|nr:hypothetical protein AN644_00165 [Epulopiscium sp. SCG-C06WGA-EpuloA1]